MISVSLLKSVTKKILRKTKIVKYSNHFIQFEFALSLKKVLN